MKFAKGTIVRHNREGNRYESDGNGGWTGLGDGDYYPPGSPFTWALREEEAFAKAFTVVKQPLGLKVGDKVRLTGKEWSLDSDCPVETGDIVTVDYLEGSMAGSSQTENLTGYEGQVLDGYEIELVEDNLAEGLRQSAAGEVESLGDFTQYADDEIREVNLETVVEDVNYLIECMRGLGFRRNEARRTIITSIGLAVPEGDE